MSKFCGKCGSKLDEATGLCPNCDADKIQKDSTQSQPSEVPEQMQADTRASEKPLGGKDAKKQSKSERRAQKKAAKKEKRAQWSTGKKVRRFLLKLILIILLIAALAAGSVGMLVYFGVVDIPVLSTIILGRDRGTQSTSIILDNGDRVFTPAEEHIAYDADSSILYFNNQLIVYTFSNLSEENASDLADLVDGEIVGHIRGSINALQIQVKPSTLAELESMAARLMESTDVLYAGYDYPIQLFPTEVDSNPWKADRSSSETDRGNEHDPKGNDWWAEAIGAYTAWNYSDECQPVKVGIIDSGFDADHEDLRGCITFLPDYAANTEADHGTHVAGIIGARNNAIGIRGIADSADLVCVDWSPTDSISYLSTGEYIEIIKQLIEADVKIINNSWGNYFASKEGYTQRVYGEDDGLIYLLEYFAIHSTGAYDSYIEYCEAFSKRTGLECILMMIQLMLNGDDDFLIVQAAGNGEDNGGPGVDTNYSACFCAVDVETYNILSESTRTTLAQKGIDYDTVNERILIVGAVENKRNENGNYIMSQYSNFGANVDICAPGGRGGDNPGQNIFSTLTSNSYGELSGTSMAAPMVSGSAAFVWSLKPELSAPEVRQILLTNSTTQAQGVGDGAQYVYPMLNVGAAAEAILPDRQIDQFELPAGTVEFNGHYYYVYDIDTITDWNMAQAYCEAQGGYLATITSSEEDAFLYSYITDAGYSSVMFGLTDQEQTDDWRWVTGEEFSYQNWRSWEPNHQGGYEHYGMYYERNTDGTWNDGSGRGGPFLCEWGEYTVAPGNEPAQELVRTTSDERDIVLVLDVSGSMSGTPMEETQKASVNFIDTILEEDASIGIVTYDDNAEQLSDFSIDRSHLTEIASDISSGGGTNIEAGLAEAKSMLDSSNAKKKIIVLMSDGEPNKGKEGEELIAYADEIKSDDVLIYTLGFFENMGGNKSSAQYLMEQLASDGCHYEVSSADDLVFFFEDMADQINGQKYIYIRIACPVDVDVTYNGEILSTAQANQNLRTNFGTITFEQSEEAEDGDDPIKILRLKEGPSYDVQIMGTDHGWMDYTIGFMNENGEYGDFRQFKNIPIERRTIIDTVAAVQEETILQIDEDGDGHYDYKLRATENGEGEEMFTAGWIVYASVGGGLIVIVVVLILIFRHKQKNGRRQSNMGKFCGNCGAPIESGTRVCGQCGTPVEDAFVNSSVSKVEVKKDKKHSHVPKWVGIIAIVLIIVFAVAAIIPNFTGYKGLTRKIMSACMKYDTETIADMASVNYDNMNFSDLEDMFASRIDSVLNRLDVDDWRDADLSYEIEGYFDMPVWMVEAVTSGQAPEDYLETLDEIQIASALLTDDSNPRVDPVRLVLIMVKENGTWKLAEMQTFA